MEVKYSHYQEIENNFAKGTYEHVRVNEEHTWQELPCCRSAKQIFCRDKDAICSHFPRVYDDDEGKQSFQTHDLSKVIKEDRKRFFEQKMAAIAYQHTKSQNGQAPYVKGMDRLVGFCCIILRTVISHTIMTPTTFVGCSKCIPES
jgi:hypothetical protein